MPPRRVFQSSIERRLRSRVELRVEDGAVERHREHCRAVGERAGDPLAATAGEIERQVENEVAESFAFDDDRQGTPVGPELSFDRKALRPEAKCAGDLSEGRHLEREDTRVRQGQPGRRTDAARIAVGKGQERI